jgi:hypothetical protein
MNAKAWLITASVVSLTGCSGPQPPPFKPLADTKLLMNAVMDPAADVIWGSAGQIITAEGTQDLRPTTDEGWAHVRNNAIGLAETGNLLMMVPRAKDDEWMRISQAMVDVAATAARAAEAKDADALFEAGANIYSVCTNCHSKYMAAITEASQ